MGCLSPMSRDLRFRTGPVYHKAGVVSPADVAAANFRSEEANLGVPGPDEGIRRGM